MDITQNQEAKSEETVMIRPAFVGLDVHKESIVIAVTQQDASDYEPKTTDFGRIKNDWLAMKMKIGQLRQQFGPDLRFVYEAGPCGYQLLRMLRKVGHSCEIVAPTEIPKRPGDRVKTDRLDARKLSSLATAGALRWIWVPDADQEALRNLIRDRRDLKDRIASQKRRIQAFLNRSPHRYSGKSGSLWSEKHRSWMLDLSFEESANRHSLHHNLDLLGDLERRLSELEKDIECELQDWRWLPVATELCALRGVDRLVAVSTLLEIGDMRRFPSARQFMSYLGLTPSEYSSGGHRRTGGITKTGNGEVRRLLTESAWTYRHPARETKHLQRKAQAASDYAKERAWVAQKRICKGYAKKIYRGKNAKTAVTAAARELAGFIWDIACHALVRQEEAKPLNSL